MDRCRKCHPSGRPVRQEPRTVGPSRWNVPSDGYVIPRLRQSHRIEAVGFVTTRLPGHQDYED